jgi:hypothetical protein
MSTQWHQSKSVATFVCRLELKIARLSFKISQPHQLPTPQTTLLQVRSGKEWITAQSQSQAKHP